MMKQHQQQLTYQTRGRNTYDISDKINAIVDDSGVEVGLCHIFIHHTSASLIITENADPDVRRDLELIMQRIAPDGDPQYMHILEGMDDMSAHIRNILTQTEISIPIIRGKLGLGTWQGIYLWEHRTSGFNRKLTITIQGTQLKG